MPTTFIGRLAGQRLFAILLILAYSSLTRAQTDSVTISGQIKHLTPRLYRESPTVLITSTNVLLAGQELAHPAPLQPDGTFRVTISLVYPQEELYFTVAQVSTAFLAAAGTLTIDIDADSLFVAAVPFRFGGVNAQVNQQFASYKAYEALNKPKVDGPTLSRRVTGLDGQRAFSYLYGTFSKPIRDFGATRPVYPLLTRWVTSIARYDAASFLYDLATDTDQKIQSSLTDSLRPAYDRLLTAAYATAMNRFSIYASKQIGLTPERSVSVKQLVSLLTRYSRNLSDTDQNRLLAISQKGGATGSDMRFLNTLMEKSGGVIRRLLLFDVSMQRARVEFDSASVDYLEASSLATATEITPLAELPLMLAHIRPLIGDSFILTSLDAAYARATKDSVAIRTAATRLATTDSLRGSVEVATGIFMTRNRASSASQLLNEVVRNNPNRVIYVLRWTPGDPQSLALVQAAQRLRDTFSNRDLAVLYISDPGVDPTVWQESVIRQKIRGEHLYLTDNQWGSDLSPLPPYEAPAYLIDRRGRGQRKVAELPTDYDKLVEQIQKLLTGK